MSASRVGTALRQLSELFHGRRVSERSDGQLLERFLSDRDETAFAALVQRHGNLVLGVCRRILGNSHDAEDAFQASFLVLIRSAAAIRRQESLASWLYGVAHRTALKARTAAARRRTHERQAAMPSTASTEPTWDDLRPVLDEELSQLPEHYRTPLILCYLEGKSKEEAARELDCPPGTISSRLTRARELLRGRLARRGVTLSALGLVALLEQSSASANVSAGLALATLESALSLAAGKPAGVSASIMILTEGVLQAMLMSKIRMTGLVIGVPLLLLVAGVATYGALAQSGGGEAGIRANTRANPQDKEQSKPAESKTNQASGERLKKIIQLKRDAAKEEADLRFQEFEAGRGTLDSLMECNRHLVDAECELATDKKTRLNALNEYFELMKKIEAMTKERFDAGKIAGQDFAAIRYRRYEAEQRLEEEKLK